MSLLKASESLHNKRFWSEKDWERFFLIQDQWMWRWIKKTKILPRLKLSEFPWECSCDSPFESSVSLTEEGPALEQLPIYQQACSFTQRIVQRFQNRPRRGSPLVARTRKRISSKAKLPDWELLNFHASCIAADIAAGHALGYDPHCVFGNIAKCRRALSHAEMCVSLLSRSRGFRLSQPQKKELFAKALRVRNALRTWIDDLRNHFTKPTGS